MVRRLVAGLLMLAALVAVAGSGTIQAFPDAAFAQSSDAHSAVVDQRQGSVQEFVSTARDAERPCGRNGSAPGLARCSPVQCITVCGGLPTAAFAIPPPSADGDAHRFVTDDPSRGISTTPDLPPPRPSA
jgi:hypothetical protein